MSTGHSGHDTRSSTPGSQINGPVLARVKEPPDNWRTVTRSGQLELCLPHLVFTLLVLEYYTGYSKVRMPRTTSFWLISSTTCPVLPLASTRCKQ
ncbi:hypothetical protein SCLCIDRAFT_1212203 [Scleroderma citrinum Foug A]|uniref:Uncharacterized protein n=1 Tax=Scleroderma citrinum Foug A TaxID=1036808 RepID=A0A0C2ZVG6_9AGAM|nr:hypothetical protein SCLCIDRAFT_1212203 [Scleroderma citrinum Foug A]